MKTLIVLLLLLLNSACASPLKKHTGIHPELRTYVDDFVRDSKGKVSQSRMKGLTMGFRDFDEKSSTIGMCNYVTYEIDISRTYWNSWYTSLHEKIELVYHELGHCVLKRGHTAIPMRQDFLGWLESLGFKIGLFEIKGYLDDKCPASMMHPESLSVDCIQKHYDYYIDELFNRKVYDWNKCSMKYKAKKDLGKKGCKKAIVVNNTNEWTERDRKSLMSTHKRCPELYGTCLKKFVKRSHLNYWAICE